ncbi:hypothetical protein JXA85_06030 [Candidatus Woesearchaeota archaeon]|nr:hypothetical protein [Candidatus Woesearchaeota archaeon]
MKDRITITIDRELLEWIDKKVGEKFFASRSHGFESLVSEKKSTRVEIIYG